MASVNSSPSDPARSGPRRSGRWVAFFWLVLLGSSFAAAWRLPTYVDSLDQRILYANPDCMAVVADSMGALGLSTAERQDSVMPWTRSCQEGRQLRLLEHANRVGLFTTSALALLSVFTLALTLAWGWGRLRERHAPVEADST